MISIVDIYFIVFNIYILLITTSILYINDKIVEILKLNAQLNTAKEDGV
jgi:hypothetical protein